MAYHQIDFTGKICTACHHNKDYTTIFSYCKETPTFRTEYLSVRQLELMGMITNAVDQIPGTQGTVETATKELALRQSQMKQAQGDLDDARKVMKQREDNLVALVAELEESLGGAKQLVLPSVAKELDSEAIGRSE
jgi:hypothetical protein